MSNKKRNLRIFTSFTITIVVITIAVMLILLKISFIIGEEITIKLNTDDKSFNLFNENSKDISIELDIAKHPACKARCSFEFVDTSHGTILDTGIVENLTGPLKFNYTISAPEKGRGQIFYNFRTTCNNIESKFCWTKETQNKKTLLLTLNYEFEEGKELQKESTKETLIPILEEYKIYFDNFQKVNNTYTSLVSLLIIDGRFQSIASDNVKKLTSDLNYFKELWSLEEYKAVENKLNNFSFNNFKEQINELDNYQTTIFNNHNKIIQQIFTTEKILNEINEYTLEYNKSILQKEIQELTELKNKMSVLNITSYDSINSEEKMTKSFTFNLTILNEANKDLNKIIELINIKNQQACILLGNCSGKEYKKQFRNYSSYVSIKESICNLINSTDTVNVTYNISEYTKGMIDNYIESISDEYTRAVIIEENKKVNQINNRVDTINSLSLGENLTIYCDGLSKYFNQVTDLYIGEYLIEKLTNECPGATSLTKVKKQSFQILTSSNINKTIVQNNQDYIREELKISINTSFCHATEDNNSINASKAINNSLALLSEINLTEVPYPEPTVNKEFNTTLIEHKPICCLFGECKYCCEDFSCIVDPTSFPIILVHGHLFNKDNSPEFSLDAFTSIQNKFEEDGYINGGIVLPSDTLNPDNPGEWGVSGRPMAIKTTYYYDIVDENGTFINFPKINENITTYAQRLEKIINYVKYKTGRPQVIIIAHSMGGLVSREYMRIAGADSVYKLIMVGTPNNGIDENAKEACLLIGESQECTDMSFGSEFLKNLKSSETTFSEMSVIYGSGCPMNEIDGDGIVYAHSAMMPNAKNYKIDGECVGLKFLHETILKNENTYSYIKKILE